MSLYDPHIRYSDIELIENCGGYSEELLHYLGAVTVESIDVNDYEGASIIHDMGTPIPDEYIEKFSLVMDGGTIEHVYKCTVALENCMRMVRPGGHLIICTPTSQYSGHGFYQFSPELFYSLLDDKNGFAVQDMFLLEANGNISKVKAPSEVHGRGELYTRSPADLFVVAQKTGPMPSELTVFQSYYISVWDGNDITTRFKTIPVSIKKHIPLPIKNTIKRLLFPSLSPTKRINLYKLLKQRSKKQSAHAKSNNRHKA